MELKDWITIITLIVTIISSHWLASKQTRKTKRAKWIEDFRFEMAKYFSLSVSVNSKHVSSLVDLSTCTWVIIMLLDDNSKTQLQLIEQINSFGLFVSGDLKTNHIQEYKERVQVIKDLAKKVINEEERKI